MVTPDHLALTPEGAVAAALYILAFYLIVGGVIRGRLARKRNRIKNL